MSCNNQNSAIGMVADTGSPEVNGIKDFFSIGSKNLSFGDNRKKNFFPQLQLTHLLQID